MAYLTREEYDDGYVVESNKICFACWNGAMSAIFDNNYRATGYRSLVRFSYLAKKSIDPEIFDALWGRWAAFLLYDLGLAEFFTDKEKEAIIDNGVVSSTRSKYKSYYQLAAIMVPFRYVNEYPELVREVFRLVDLGHDAVDSFFAAHFTLTPKKAGHNHTVVHLLVNKTYRDYLSRIRNPDNGYGMSDLWSSDGTKEYATIVLPKTVTLYLGPK